MSLFDSASLVVTPNGYKEDKLYSIKPTDGSGDLVVTRATTATRVNSAGLIEQVPYNLLQYSQQIGTSPWAYSAADVNLTSTSIISPSGSADSIRVTNTTANGSVPFYQLFTSLLNTYTYSIYVKKDTNRYFGLILTSGASTQNRYGVYFDLQNGVVHQVFNTSTPLTNTSNSITDAGNGWYRCSITATCESAVYVVGQSTNNGTLALNPLTGDLTNATTGIVYVWGAQAVTGSSAKEYFPTTDRLNVPRLDYTNSTCPSILVEPQRTNVLTYSEQFNDSSWVKEYVSITANSTTAPDGTLTADKLIPSTVANSHVVLKSIVGAAQSFSVYAKAAEYSTLILFFTVHDAFATFNLSNGTITETIGTVTAKIESVGNGWYRCVISTTLTNHNEARIYSVNGTTVADVNIAGNGTSGIYVWGAQLEQGSYATSYIPTVASSVTRNADVISKTGISSLIGQTEGTMFFDVYRKNSNAPFFLLIGNSTGANAYLNSIYFVQTTSSVLILEVFASGTSQARITTASGLSIGRHKIAVGYKQNDFVLYIDGIQIGTDTSGNLPPLSALEINGADESYLSNIGINSAILWKTKLSNTELASLTTI